jgi:hypothetical protein
MRSEGRDILKYAAENENIVSGRRLHARTLPNQKTEAKIGCNVLNRMTTLGMPATVRIR